MKIISAILFLLLAVTLSTSGQRKNDSKRAEDAPDKKSVNGFGAGLVVVNNPDEFMRNWVKPETPKIEPATDVKRGESIGALVLFAGCKQDGQGICNAEVDYTIYKPDGSLYAERKGGPLWKVKAPPEPNIQLGNSILGFRMGKDDPSGGYKVKAKVYDLNANISFELETKFRLN